MAFVLPHSCFPIQCLKMTVLTNHDDDFKWRCLQARTPSTAFVYAVKTTKIFCRPECPARLARRANVIFFDSGTQAQQADFRACKRCKPDLAPCNISTAPKPIVIQSPVLMQHSTEADELSSLAPGEQNARRRAAIKTKRVLISSQGRKPWKEVAREVGLSPRYLFEAFKAIEGVTPGVYSQRLRSNRRAALEADIIHEQHEMTSTTPASSSSDGLDWSQFDSTLADFIAEDLDAYMLSPAYGIGEGQSHGHEQLVWTPAETTWDSLSSVTTPRTPGRDNLDRCFAEPTGELSLWPGHQKSSNDTEQALVYEVDWMNGMVT
ncbi:bifunctional transcriptional activator/dna repair enzyme ada [Acrodontium crateriforme]|uniref:Bifunctional transcriptional activator/dna repair enzyme ada n=1 Tax=Acrodontium crateriforme TaxID=150365 RepID=A0AAQ3MA82_9PEZI|nr:bifunctional transcriptional activator/dna repair enzyme ada [Acrodontium crateriforme]